MADSDGAAADEPDDSPGASFKKRDALMIAVLSLAAIASITRFELSFATVFDRQFSTILDALLPLLLLLPLPAAYIAAISKDGFRKEVAGTLVTLPAAVLDLTFAVGSIGIVLGGVLVSYKAKSIYNGQNTNWVHFKAAGSMVVVLAIVAGIATAAMYSTTPPLREDIRSNITQQSVDTALEYADMAGMGGTQDVSLGEQDQGISAMVGTLAENLSQASIQSTEAIVFQAVEETRNRDSSKFDADERTVLRAAFDTAESNVPTEVRQQAEDQVEQRFTSGSDSGQVEEAAMRSMVTPRVRSFVNELITDSHGMTLTVLIATFSLVMLFKLPFELLSAIYAAILGRLRS
jgi:hypothetical protein